MSFYDPAIATLAAAVFAKGAGQGPEHIASTYYDVQKALAAELNKRSQSANEEPLPQVEEEEFSLMD